MRNREHIQNLITTHPIVLFMKGTKMQPRCGFSSMVVQALAAIGITDLHDVDILEDPELRQDIKDFTDWPTLPQLYVKGKFIGGADIVQEMLRTGELKDLMIREGVIDV